MKIEFYYAKIRCSNCDFGLYGGVGMEIPKGTTTKQFSKEKECPDCGCKRVLYYRGWTDKENCDYPFHQKLNEK